MCTHAVDAFFNGFYHHVNPQDLCRATFSFGFYIRHDFGGLNPYGLVPFPSANLYLAPFNVWTFGVNLRIKCQQHHDYCNQNILLAQQIHALWYHSPIWSTHPHYVAGPFNQGVDFIARPNVYQVYIVTGNLHNPLYREIADWFIEFTNNHETDIQVEEVEELPDGGVDLLAWILTRINDINNLEPFQNYIQENGLGEIPINI